MLLQPALPAGQHLVCCYSMQRNAGTASCSNCSVPPTGCHQAQLHNRSFWSTYCKMGSVLKNRAEPVCRALTESSKQAAAAASQ